MLYSTEIGEALWNLRFVQMRLKGMHILHSRKLLPDLKWVSLEFCENRVYGKQKRFIFLMVGKHKKSENLKLVHIYVWGPTQAESLDGSCYYVTLINDAFRKTWVYCVTQKSAVFSTFKKWKDLVENETRKML